MKLGKKTVSSALLIYLILAALLNLIIFVVFKPINLEISRLLSSNFLSRKGSLLKMFPWS